MAKEKQIIAATFDTKNGAKDALRALKYKMVKHGKGMVLSKSEKGKVKVKDTFNWGVFAGAKVVRGANWNYGNQDGERCCNCFN